MQKITDFIQNLSYRIQKPLEKNEVAKGVAEKFRLKKSRSVYWNNNFAIRFSSAKGKGFSNTVLSLATLKKYDHLPFIVCVVRNDTCELLLANSTFLKKISHSSHQLTTTNIKGSFNGSDIIREYGGYKNAPENFKILFEIHQEILWVDNLQRLVNSTNEIQGTGRKFLPTSEQQENIYQSIDVARRGIEFVNEIKLDIDRQITQVREEIFRFAQIDNVNQRGNYIEQVITGDVNRHELGDLYFQHQGINIILDIKTKIFGKSSNPKGFNIDKLLAELSKGGIFYGYLFLGIDRRNRQIRTLALSFLDSTIIDFTRIQFHWAGRNSRGATQLSGDFELIFQPGFDTIVDTDKASRFLDKLLDS